MWLTLLLTPIPASAAPTIFATGACPGEMELRIADADPGAPLAVLSADGPGEAALPAGPCAGLISGLSPSSLRHRATASSDPSGEATLGFSLPAAACSQWIQVVDLSSCEVTTAGPLVAPAPITRSVDAADAVLLGEGKQDASGVSIATVGDVNGDGFEDILVGAHGSDRGSRDGGAAYLVHGPISGPVDLGTADAIFVGEGFGASAGEVVSGAGDLNADGFDDLLISAPGDAEDLIYVLYGPLAGTIDLAGAGGELRSEEDYDNAGLALAAAGDVNGDGFDDVLVGAYHHDDGGIWKGAAYLVHGPILGSRGLGTAAAKFVGEHTDDQAGNAVAAGDLNGDGTPDLVVGAYTQAEGGPSAGAVYVIFGPVTGEHSLAAADAKLVGEGADDWAGTTVATGDFNGDGIDDLLIGAERESTGGLRAGAAYVVYGPVGGTLGLAAADAKLVAENEEDRAGVVASAGDVNGDGNDDILVGSFGHDSDSGEQAGAVYLFHGPIYGELDLAAADAIWLGDGTRSYAGSALAGGGDLDGDGLDDILIGAWGADVADKGEGKTYLFHGPL
jgi:hypothetical protein